MNKIFTYSLLQYKPSLLSGEVLNVGILFIFYEEQKINFIYDNTNRLKLIFSNFDKAYYNNIVEYIDRKSRAWKENLIAKFPSTDNIIAFIHEHFISANSTSLQFSQPVNSVKITNDTSKIVSDFTQLFLPYFSNYQEPIGRKDEAYIVKSLHTKLLQKDKNIDNKITRGNVISDNKVDVNFDYEWPNEKIHLVKGLSFDYRDKHKIQNKIVLNENYFNRLFEYAKRNNIVIDVLAVFPQEEELIGYCLDKIELLKSIPELVNIFYETQFDNYADETISGIQHHFGLN